MEQHRTTADLVAAGKAGDLASLDQLVRQYQDRAYALAYSRLRDHHLAEDVAQATMVQAMISLGSVRKPESLPSWLRHIALSQCSRVWRGQRGSRVALEDRAEIASDQPSPPQRLEQAEAADDLRHALASLRPSDREILTLFYMQDLGIRDLADWLKATPMAVKKRLHTARSRLKERMIQMMQEDLEGHLPSRNEQFARDVRQMLQQLCRDGIHRRFPSGGEQVEQRWRQEARQLDRADGQSFWQTAWQLTRFIREQDIPCSPGRGRTPASLLAYLLDISRINPLEFGLSYARNPDPGKTFIAFDVCYQRIDEVTAFVRDTWPDQVARFDRWPKERYRELYVAARPLGDLGIAIDAKDDLGLTLVSREDCQRLQENGALAVTLVGSRTITQIHAAKARIVAAGKEAPDLDHLDWNDPRPLQLLAEGALDHALDLLDWNFVVQQKTLRRIRPQRFSDLMVVLPLLAQLAHKQPQLLEQYVASKDAQARQSLPPIVREHLADTYGVLLYDEQFAGILAAATGWPTWSDRTWQLQDALHRRIEPAVANLRTEFIAAARDQGLEPSHAQAVWDVLAASEGWYSKAAAVGFAVAVFQAAWLKTYFPDDFEAAAVG